MTHMIVIRKSLSTIHGILSPKKLFFPTNFLQIELFSNETLRFPPIPAFRILWNFRRGTTFWQVIIRQAPLKSDMNAEKMPFAIDIISTRNCYLIIEGWAFVAIAGFSHAFKLLLWRLPKILAPLRARNEMSYDYCKVMKAGAPRSFLIRSL